MVVCSGIGSADDHDCHVVVRAGGVDTVVVYGWLQEVSVFGEPGFLINLFSFLSLG